MLTLHPMESNEVFAEWVHTHDGTTDWQRIVAAAERLGVTERHCYDVAVGRRGVSRQIAQGVHDLTGGRYSRDELLFGRDTAA